MCDDIYFESSPATSYCNLSCLSTHALFSWNLTPCLHCLQSYHVCDQCEKLFSSTSNLFNHMQTEHVRSSIHPCETCSTMFESKENLDSHIFFTHTMPMPSLQLLREYVPRYAAPQRSHSRISWRCWLFQIPRRRMFRNLFIYLFNDSLISNISEAPDRSTYLS